MSMKTLKIRKTTGYTYKIYLLYLSYQFPKITKHVTKLIPRHNPFTQWFNMQTISLTLNIYMTIDKNIRYYRKIEEKLRGFHYRITHIKTASCPELPNLVLN